MLRPQSQPERSETRPLCFNWRPAANENYLVKGGGDLTPLEIETMIRKRSLLQPPSGFSGWAGDWE
jgi:hypothetical protein